MFAEKGYQAIGFDVDGAYLQSPRRGSPTWIILPPALLPEELKGRAEKMRVPVLRLDRALYGEKDAGDGWNAYLGVVLRNLGWEKEPAAGGEEVWRRGVLVLGVYVDDGIIVGPEGEALEALRQLSARIVTKPPEILVKHLGVHIVRYESESAHMAAFAQEGYARHLLERFLAEAGVRAIRTYATPGVSQADAGRRLGANRRRDSMRARRART